MIRTTRGHRISWTGTTWNPGIFGCTLAGPECTSCYAATLAHRGLGPYADYKGRITHQTANGVTWTGKVFTDLERVKSTAARLPKSKRELVFTTSMSDLFHRDVPNDFLIAVHAEMAMRPHLTFQVLTKRPDRMAELYQRSSRHPMRQARSEAVPPINLVILGGEAKRTRRDARPFDLDAARKTIDYINRCGDGVDVMVKQLGTHWAKAAGAKSRDGGDPSEWSEDLQSYHGLPGWLATAAGLK